MTSIRSRFARRCLPLLLVCAALLHADPARGYTPAGSGTGFWEAVRTRENSGVTIGVASPVTVAPPTGALPLVVTIHNNTAAAHTWTIRTGEDSYGGKGDVQSSETSLRVEPQGTASLAVLAPQGAPDTGSPRYRRRYASVEGYDVTDPRVELPPSNSTSYSGTTSFVGMGSQLATPIWASLTQRYTDDHRSLQGSPVAANLLGADWRGYVGFDCLWLTDDEYASLPAETRAALRQWLDGGGMLYLSARDLAPAIRAELELPAGAGESHPGFGTVRVYPWDGKGLDLKETAARIDEVTRRAGHSHPSFDDLSLIDARKWDMFRRLGNIPLHAPFLIGFIGVFALVVGPLNLFKLAPAHRRHRLFWTTPLISLAASLLLVAVIVLQDGFGGTGERMMLTLLLPARREAVVVQEQMAHTGVLLSRGFTLPEDADVTLVSDGREGAVRRCERAGRDFGGDWFTSRSVQAMRLRAVVPSRAEIQLTRAGEGNTPPEIVSSIPATLRELRYTDPAGRHWRAENVRTGERATLRATEVFTRPEHGTGSALFETLAVPYLSREGGFYAVAKSGAPFLATLPAIRWQRQDAVYFGVVTPVR